MPKQRYHNEWFDGPLTKYRCGCGRTKVEVWSWCEYVNAKRRLILHFCEFCFEEIESRILPHSQACGCETTLVIQGLAKSKVGKLLVKLQNKIRKAECSLQKKRKKVDAKLVRGQRAQKV